SIWAEIIGFSPTQDRPTIGIHDNFFELGGDSILSIQVIARAAQAGLRLTPRQLFESPTIAGLAAAAEDFDATQPTEEQPVAAGEISQNNLEDFGWSQDDLDDILGAIGSSLDDDEPEQS
ncbi:MAG: phosphopantetheine-binding protein, partial [Anaerolineales bacterium]|nr:phosphopantetheine-binding protein [Anaerolineales bacterium]